MLRNVKTQTKKVNIIQKKVTTFSPNSNGMYYPQLMTNYLPPTKVLPLKVFFSLFFSSGLALFSTLRKPLVLARILWWMQALLHLMWQCRQFLNRWIRSMVFFLLEGEVWRGKRTNVTQPMLSPTAAWGWFCSSAGGLPWQQRTWGPVWFLRRASLNSQ